MTDMSDMGNAVAAPNDMGGMSHPESTLFVPPLLDERLLNRFVRAVQAYADSQGMGTAVKEKLDDLQTRLQGLVDLAVLFRYAALGQQSAALRLRDEIQCLVVDFPDALPDLPPAMWMDEPDPRVQLAPALDLFAAAAFVSGGASDQLGRSITGLVRAIENAVAFPLSFAAEAEAYLGEGDGSILPRPAAIAIAIATGRLLEGDMKCVPQAPESFRQRLEGLAAQWLRGNPVSALLDAVTDPVARGVPMGLVPRAGKVGDFVKLHWTADGLDRTSMTVVMSPHHPAKVVEWTTAGVTVQIPEGAQSGPVLLARQPAPWQLEAIASVQNDLQRRYAMEWPLSALATIPLVRWAYPLAFAMSPTLQILREDS